MPAKRETRSTEESYLVIGGEGFLGSTLVKALIARFPGRPVASLDLVQRHFPEGKEKSQWSFYSADLTSLDQLAKAIKASSATCVFHTASPWTGSGVDVCEKVNVEGTRTIVEACVQEGVKKLVFTSSAGTVYNGEDLRNVDERLPFPAKFHDPYNRTKAEAETIVLAANGKNGLLTVALRPAGIFGPGDRQALPGVLDVLKSGKSMFQIGDNTNLFDWTYVDNVVEAHLVASERLDRTVPVLELSTRLPGVDKDLPKRVLPTSTYRPESLMAAEKKFDPKFKNTSEPDEPLPANRNRFDQFFTDIGRADEDYKVAGEAFFITNGEPIPFWDFPRAVWAEYNGHVPSYTVVLPVGVGLTFAGIGETISMLTRRTPNLTRAKVTYSTVNRYYNIEKARRVLGYEPVVGLGEGIKRAVAWYKENEKSQATKA